MESRSSASLPLCVDLDGTLIRSDVLHEQFFGNPWAILALFHLMKGRAAFKEEVAARSHFDVALLPYNETLIEYLHQQKQTGRHLVLATAANAKVAKAIADHLGLFDEVIASDGNRNLKGAEKARVLTQRFGSHGFCYAGNAASDLAVWREAASAIVVNAPAKVLAQVQNPVELVVADKPRMYPQLLKAMRPYQWTKNILVFIPLLTAHRLLVPTAWAQATIMFVAFCAAASGIYLINDMVDIWADRAHRRKRLRPFASGTLSLATGGCTAVALIVVGLLLSWSVNTEWLVGLYVTTSVSYSLYFKVLPLVDVFLLSSLYTMRLFGGGEATGYHLSLWLLGFSSFLFLSLALLKRVEEMASGTPRAGRRGYGPNDAAILQLFGVASTFTSSVVLALFVQHQAEVQSYASPGLLWLIVPLLLFWQARMWLAGSRGYMHDDPIIYAAHDRVSWASGLAVSLVLVAAKSMPL